MGFEFKKPEKRRIGEPSSENKEYRDRAKADKARYNLAVDTEFWLCFCFADSSQRDRFAKIVGADGDWFAFGDSARDAFEAKIGSDPKRQFAALHPEGAAVPDPLSSVEYTGDLESDSFAEAQALLEAFEAVDRKESYSDVFDTAYYVTVVFRDSAQVSAFLADYNLLKYGDKYMNGPPILEKIE